MRKASPKVHTATSYPSDYQDKAVRIVCIALMLALATLAWRIAIA